MQLKEFPFISPVLESTEVFKAIETVIPPDAIAQIAIQLQTDNEWEPTPGEHCYNCAYSRYCHAVSDRPLALPETVRTTTDLQLALNL